MDSVTLHAHLYAGMDVELISSSVMIIILSVVMAVVVPVWFRVDGRVLAERRFREVYVVRVYLLSLY